MTEHTHAHPPNTHSRILKKHKLCVMRYKAWYLEVITGFLVGLFIHRFSVSRDTSYKKQTCRNHSPASPIERKLLLVGIMTTQEFVRSRGVATYDAWASRFPGEVVYFSSESTVSPGRAGMRVVALPGVDDTYPPQEKSFRMLQYMHDHHGDQYEWFMRADDDSFVKGHDLARFLRSLNSSKPYYLGQSGQGKAQEFGRLNLQSDENYCMGGPGVVFSRATLKAIAPNTDRCLSQMATTHEDVELGRCVRRFAGVSCTWAYEMRNLFYFNYADRLGSFINPSFLAINRALTLHPIKNHTYQYSMRLHTDSHVIRGLKHRRLQLHREVQHMSRMMQQGGTQRPEQYTDVYHPRSRGNVIPWEHITDTLFYSHKDQNPRRKQSIALRTAIKRLKEQLMDAMHIRDYSQSIKIDYGYMNIEPHDRVSYAIKYQMMKSSTNGKNKQVNHHLYLHQSLEEPIFRELDTSINVEYHINVKPRTQINKGDKVVNFILPLYRRLGRFLFFLDNFERIFLQKHEAVALIVTLFDTNSDKDISRHAQETFQKLQYNYPHYDLRMLVFTTNFSRGNALTEGAKVLTEDALMFFIDVDMFIERRLLQRVRFNTVLGRQAYFPIMFSQYDPQTFCIPGQTCVTADHTYFGDDAGYWRYFSYGNVGLYRADFFSVGGFDKDIRGWGLEDTDLYERFIGHRIRVLRAPEPGLIHRFHPMTCDSTLTKTQYDMCVGSKRSTYGSMERLAQVVYANEDMLNKNG